MKKEVIIDGKSYILDLTEEQEISMNKQIINYDEKMPEFMKSLKIVAGDVNYENGNIIVNELNLEKGFNFNGIALFYNDKPLFMIKGGTQSLCIAHDNLIESLKTYFNVEKINEQELIQYLRKYFKGTILIDKKLYSKNLKYMPKEDITDEDLLTIEDFYKRWNYLLKDFMHI